jgi:NADH-quinone oxidoreductase subunit G
VVSLELRASAVTECADVVFPVAAVAEKSGAFVNWEGRHRPFGSALGEYGTLDEGRILDTLGVEMDVDLYTQTPIAARADMGRLGVWAGPSATALPAGTEPTPAAATGVITPEPHLADLAHDVLVSLQSGLKKLTSLGAAQDHEPQPARGTARPEDVVSGGLVLASWRMALDGGRGLDGEPHLAGTAKPDVCRLSAVTANRLGLHSGEPVTVTGPTGSAVTLPLAVTDMVDGVVWLPARVRQTPLVAQIGAVVGDRVRVERFSASEGHSR